MGLCVCQLRAEARREVDKAAPGESGRGSFVNEPPDHTLQRTPLIRFAQSRAVTTRQELDKKRRNAAVTVAN